MYFLMNTNRAQGANLDARQGFGGLLEPLPAVRCPGCHSECQAVAAWLDGRARCLPQQRYQAVHCREARY